MTNYGKKIDQGSLCFERLLPGPIERVWAFLTESEKRRTWFAAGPMELRAGGKVELIFRNSELAAQYESTPEKYKAYEGMTSYGRITRCEAPRLLSFTWDEENASPSEVTFELKPQGDQVQLVLIHRKLASRKDMVNVSGGWHAHLGILEARLKGLEPGPFWSEILRLESEYEKIL